MANEDVVGEENVPDGDMEAQRHQHGVLNHNVIDDLEDDHESIDVHGEDSYRAINDHGVINDHGEDPHEAYHEDEDLINIHDENPFENNNGQEDPIHANGELQIRRGTRIRRPSQRFLDLVNSIDENEPLSLKEALNRPNEAKWKEDVKMEYKSLMYKKTWDLVQLPQNRQPLGCKWIFKIKKKVNGSLDKYKARLVAKGYDQIESLDYNEIFSPMVRMATMRLLFGISAILDLELQQMDVKTTFLNGDLNEIVYMQQLEGFFYKETQNLVCLLGRSIYGLRQSPRMWNENISSFLLKLDFIKSIKDNGLYIL